MAGFSNPFGNPFGLSPDAMQRMDGGVPMYGAAPQQQAPLSTFDPKKYSLGADTDFSKPVEPTAKAAEATETPMTGSQKGAVASAGIQAATTLIGKLMEAKAQREKLLRERKAKAAETTAKSTQRALEEQQAGTLNPLTGLIGAYRGTL